MRWIIGSSLKFRLLVIPIAAVLMVFGVVQIRSMPADAFPEFTPPTIEVQTEALGLSAAEVEQLVTVPMEQDLLNGVPWTKQIRSESVTGESSVELVFEPGTDIMKARQLVSERLNQAPGLPHVSKPPVMLQPLSSTNRVMMVGLSSEDLSLIEMSVLARWRIKPKLTGIAGVANVAIWGMRERQLQVQVDPARLRKYGISLDQVLTTTGNALWVSPLSFVEASTPGTGGFVDTSNQRLSIQHISPIRTSGDLAKVTVEDTADRPGGELRLGDVANVVEDHQPLIGDAVVDGGPGLMLVIEKLPGANSAQISKDVQDAFAELRPGLSGITVNTEVFRPTTFVESAIDNVALSLIIGLILLMVLLGALFLDWRTGLISLVAIPLSLITAALVLYLLGAAFNTVMLAGLVIALGVVIDDAVADVANIRRRLREQRETGTEKSTMAMIGEAAVEARGPMLYATLIVLAVMAPLLFFGGVTGAFLRPLAISYILAVLASFLVALTVTPALALFLLNRSDSARADSPVVRRLQGWYGRALNRTARRPSGALLMVGAVLAVGIAVVPQLLSGWTLIPALQDRNLLIQWNTAASTSQQEMVRITAAVTRELNGVPGVDNVGAHIGRAITADQVVDVNSGQLWVTMNPDADYDKTIKTIRKIIDGYPGLSHDLQTYPADRLREAQTGSRGDLVVRVYGQDMGVMRDKAEEIRTMLGRIDGIGTATIDTETEQPTVEVEVNLAKAEQLGIKPGDVRRAAATLLSGIIAGNLFEEEKVFDVVVWGDPALRNNINSLGNLLIDASGGRQIRLKDVADVRIKPNPTTIRHDGVSRRVDVVADVQGRNAEAVAEDVKASLRSVQFPLEYHAEVIGDYTQQTDTRRRAIILAIAAIIAVFLLLQAAFSSWRLATAFTLTVPMALAGGTLAAMIVDGTFSLGSIAGLFAVLGLAVRQGIGLVRTYQRLDEEASETSGLELVLAGARERLVPIAISTLAIAGALVGVIVVGNVPGQEIVRPLAVVMLGGLVTSTLFCLFVVPALYLRFGTRRDRGDTAADPDQGPTAPRHAMPVPQPAE